MPENDSHNVFRPSNFSQHDLLKSFNLLKQIRLHKVKIALENRKFYPTKNDFELICLKLKQIKCFYGNLFEFFLLMCDRMSYFKFKIAVKILIDLKVISFDGSCLKLNTLSNRIILNNKHDYETTM